MATIELSTIEHHVQEQERKYPSRGDSRASQIRSGNRDLIGQYQTGAIELILPYVETLKMLYRQRKVKKHLRSTIQPPESLKENLLQRSCRNGRSVQYLQTGTLAVHIQKMKYYKDINLLDIVLKVFSNIKDASALKCSSFLCLQVGYFISLYPYT